MVYKRWLIFSLVLLVLIACNSSPSHARISVKNAWVRPAETGQNSAVYFQIVNEGQTADILISASSSIATAELHQSIEKEDGVMGMTPLNNVDIPAQSEVEFKPGGMHIMLINLTQPLTVSNSIPVTLNFEHGGKVVFEAEVRSLP